MFVVAHHHSLFAGNESGAEQERRREEEIPELRPGESSTGSGNDHVSAYSLLELLELLQLLELLGLLGFGTKLLQDSLGIVCSPLVSIALALRLTWNCYSHLPERSIQPDCTP